MRRFVQDWQGEAVEIPAGVVNLDGTLVVPPDARGLVIFAHGAGSSRFSPRNRFIAEFLNSSGVATLGLDLLSKEEEELDTKTGQLRFDISLLAKRLQRALKWVSYDERTKDLNVGLFGSTTGAAAALQASTLVKTVRAVVSMAGRADLVGEALPQVGAATLLIVGGDDDVTLHLNENASTQMQCVVDLKIVPGATHMFEEPGALEEVSGLATEWFERYLGRIEEQ